MNPQYPNLWKYQLQKILERVGVEFVVVCAIENLCRIRLVTFNHHAPPRPFVNMTELLTTVIQVGGVASPEVASPEVVNRKWKGDNFPPFFCPIFRAFFSGTPLESRYEQWNCESNLYRITIDLLPPMLNHFSLLNCAVSQTGVPVKSRN
jgi:hypothetical protein